MLHNFYFETGDKVRIKHFDADQVPVMIVKYKVSEIAPVPDRAGGASLDNAPALAPDPAKPLYPKAAGKPVGVLCFWFLPNGTYQESAFAFKDLLVIERARKLE